MTEHLIINLGIIDRMGQQIANDFRAGDRNIRRRFKASAVWKLNSPMVQTQLMTNGGDHVGDAYSIHDALVTKLVRFAVDQTRFESAATPVGSSFSVSSATLVFPQINSGSSAH